MTGHRIPRCQSCGDRLGNSVHMCHDCSNENESHLYGELSAVAGTTTENGVTYRGGERNVAFGELVR